MNAFKNILLLIALFIVSVNTAEAETGQLHSEPPKDGVPQGEFLALYTYTSNIVVISPGKGDTYLLVRAVDRFFQVYKNLQVVSVSTTISPTIGSIVMMIVVKPKESDTEFMNKVSEIDQPKPEKESKG
jgi:hypothetical protein